mmetsp:Transcript_13595/g.40509  ORF Transcript_13595/g.40509 Transcript_13595/m.40509 type:complete len:294 (-) Transcript_13595:62-943(-)
MTSAARSSAEASPWVLTCRGKFLEAHPAPGFSDEDAPPRPPRAASVPADMGRSRRGASPFAALESRLESFFGRLQLFRQSVAQTKGGDSRGGDSAGDPLLSRDAMDHQTSERCEAKGCDMTKLMSTTTICPDDDVHSDDMTEWATPTTTRPDGNDEDAYQYAAPTRHASEAMNNDPALRFKTLMIRNIPCRIDRDELVRVIDKQGFAGRYDFVYVPQSHRPKANIGYAFVNLVDEADEDAFTLAFNNFRFEGTMSQKICTVQPARLQGSDVQLGLHRRRRKGGRGRLASAPTP